MLWGAAELTTLWLFRQCSHDRAFVKTRGNSKYVLLSGFKREGMRSHCCRGGAGSRVQSRESVIGERFVLLQRKGDA
jgi:hypothetical protein